MPDWAQAELRLQLPEGVFKVSQSPVRAENLFYIPIGVAGSEHTGPGSSIRQLGLVLPLEANRRGSITGSLNPDPILADDARVTFFQSPDLLSTRSWRFIRRGRERPSCKYCNSASSLLRCRARIEASV